MFEAEIAREDKFIEDADLAVAVLGDGGDNFILIDVSGPNDRAQFFAAIAEAKARQFMHCGFLRRGKDMTPGVMCVDPRGVVTMARAAMSWVLANAEHFRSAPVQDGDSLEWLTRLYAVPDTRTQWPN